MGLVGKLPLPASVVGGGGGGRGKDIQLLTDLNLKGEHFDFTEKTQKETGKQNIESSLP
jgi:hypothetical protein